MESTSAWCLARNPYDEKIYIDTESIRSMTLSQYSMLRGCCESQYLSLEHLLRRSDGDIRIVGKFTETIGDR